MADRKLLLFSAALLLLGGAVYQVAEHFHPEGGATATDVFLSYADSSFWPLVHEAQFAGSAITLFGLLTLCAALNMFTGLQGMANRFAVATAVAALAMNAALYAVDGVGLKQATDAWLSAPPEEQNAYYAVVQGIRGIEWGLRSYVDFTTGLTLVLLAVVIVATARVPRLIGVMVALSGLAYIVQGYGYGSGYLAISEHFVLNSTNYQFLMFVWSVWLLVVAWRMKKSIQTALA
jgi:hypothetical protein